MHDRDSDDDAGDAGAGGEESPWAMQLAARAEKLTPPTVADTCAAAVLAVIGVLDDDRAGDGGPWSEPIAEWQGGGRIRKLVRRARASAWERAQEPEGHTAVFGSGEVRAFVPSRMNATPDAVRKLQIQSTELDEPDRVDGFPMSLARPGEPVMVVVITPTVPMTWGKQAAQSAHAGQVLWRESSSTERQRWTEGGRTVAVLHASADWWPQAVEHSRIQIRDGGFTEIPAGTMSAVAWWL